MYEPGTVLAGKYRVLRPLGRGGMGVVVAAEHVDLRTQVALKFLADKYLEQPPVIERFMREARACASLRSEHICRVSDVGRLDNGTPYIVMELLEGRDLAKVVRRGGALDVTMAAEYIAQACGAIAEAHAAGIVHRDLKPSNLFLIERRDDIPLVKVLDFGVAKAQGETDFSLTGTDNVVGSPSYMAPEQLRSAKQADARSDIWSLGVILYELVAGRPPFSGETIIDLAVRITHEPPEMPSGVTPELAVIIGRCLHKDPAMRFQHAEDLANALRPLLPATSLAAVRRTPMPRASSASVPPPLAAPLLVPPLPTAPMPPTATEPVPTLPIQAALSAPNALTPPAPQFAAAESPNATTLRTASGVFEPSTTVARPRMRWYAISAIAAISIGASAALFIKRGDSESTAAKVEPHVAPAPPPTSVDPAPAATAPPAPVAMPTVPAIDAAVETAEPAEPVIDEAEIEIDPSHKAKPKKQPPKKSLKQAKEQVGASRI